MYQRNVSSSASSVTNIILSIGPIEPPVSSIDRRFNIRRETIIDVISWVNCAPIAGRSLPTSYNIYEQRGV